MSMPSDNSEQYGKSTEVLGTVRKKCGFYVIVRKKYGKCPCCLTGCLNLTFIVKLFFGECVINYVFL